MACWPRRVRAFFDSHVGQPLVAASVTNTASAIKSAARRLCSAELVVNPATKGKLWSRWETTRWKFWVRRKGERSAPSRVCILPLTFPGCDVTWRQSTARQMSMLGLLSDSSSQQKSSVSQIRKRLAAKSWPEPHSGFTDHYSAGQTQTALNRTN